MENESSKNSACDMKRKIKENPEPHLTVIDVPEFTWEEIESARDNNRLLTVGLELSNFCNFRCVYCYRNTGNPLPDELALEELIDAAHQAIKLGARKVGIVGAGEPTLDNRLIPLLKSLKNVEKVNIFTNGTGITPELGQILVDFQVGIILKVNSLNPDIHDTLVGRKGGYNLMRKGFKNLLDAGCPPSRITIESVITKQNIKELPSLWRWSRDRGFVPFFERVTPQGRALLADVSVPPLQVLELFEEIKRIDEQLYRYTWGIHPPWVSQSCLRHYHYCLIDACGNVLPCSGVDIAVGNIREEPLADILTSPVIQDLRFIDQTIKGHCKNCEFIPFCYGCRGAAYQLTGDYLAADPQCWKPLVKEMKEDHKNRTNKK